MSHANKADRLLIKPTAGARPASPCTLGRFIPKTRKQRSDARRVTNGTDNTTLATAPDGPTQRLSQTPERSYGPLRPERCHSGRELRLRPREVHPVWTSRVGEPLHDRVAFVVVDDGDAGIRPFVRRVGETSAR